MLLSLRRMFFSAKFNPHNSGTENIAKRINRRSRVSATKYSNTITRYQKACLSSLSKPAMDTTVCCLPDLLRGIDYGNRRWCACCVATYVDRRNPFANQ